MVISMLHKKYSIILIGIGIFLIIIVISVVMLGNNTKNKKNRYKYEYISCLLEKTTYVKNSEKFGTTVIRQDLIFKNDIIYKMKVTTIMQLENGDVQQIYNFAQKKLQDTNLNYKISINNDKKYLKTIYTLNPRDDEFDQQFRMFNNFETSNMTKDYYEDKMTKQMYICGDGREEN